MLFTLQIYCLPFLIGVDDYTLSYTYYIHSIHASTIFSLITGWKVI